MRALLVSIAAIGLSACAGGSAMRTSANTIIIQAGAAPICGPEGAARAASHTAAIETIRAGYSRYVINGGSASNDVRVHQLPGHVQHSGSVSTNPWGGASYSGTSTYVPGPTIVSGQHRQDLHVTMFRQGDPGFENAIDAALTLGPDWQDKVRRGVATCL